MTYFRNYQISIVDRCCVHLDQNFIIFQFWYRNTFFVSETVDTILRWQSPPCCMYWMASHCCTAPTLSDFLFSKIFKTSAYMSIFSAFVSIRLKLLIFLVSNMIYGVLFPKEWIRRNCKIHKRSTRDSFFRSSEGSPYRYRGWHSYRDSG